QRTSRHIRQFLPNLIVPYRVCLGQLIFPLNPSVLAVHHLWPVEGGTSRRLRFLSWLMEWIINIIEHITGENNIEEASHAVGISPETKVQDCCYDPLLFPFAALHSGSHHILPVSNSLHGQDDGKIENLGPKQT